MPRPSIAPIPPGALDLSGAAVRRRRALERDAMAVLHAAGCEELSPPTFEYEEVFLRAGGGEIGDRLIRFLDRDGRSLALRYDFTACVARVAATTYGGAPRPLRFCYAGKVFRQEPDRGGRPREVQQVGAEILGDGGLGADVEMVRLALQLLRTAGMQEFQLNVGHVGVLAPGFEALVPELRGEARRLIDRKDRASLQRLLEGSNGAARTLLTLPFVMGRRDAIEALRAELPRGALGGLDQLLALDAALSPEERKHVVYDLGEVRGLDYYTGVRFEAFVAGAGQAVGGGGRYDDLMGRFGAPMPAVGLSIDIGQLAEIPL